MTDFKKLPVDELKALAEYYVVDVVSIKEDAPTKKELLTAIGGLTGDDIITDEYYEAFKADFDAKKDKPEAPSLTDLPQPDAVQAAPVDKSDWVLLKFSGQNPTLEILGYRFQSKHPFQQVPPEVAEILVLKHDGFRMALPSEVSEYYN